MTVRKQRKKKREMGEEGSKYLLLGPASNDLNFVM
jgi:hypothetical protein